MPTSPHESIPQDFALLLCRYFETGMSPQQLWVAVTTDPKSFGRHLSGLVNGHNDHKTIDHINIVRRSSTDLRLAVRRTRFLLAKTTDTLLDLTNVFYGRGRKQINGEREGKVLTIPEAVIIASFFNIPWTYLVGAANLELPWYLLSNEFSDENNKSYTCGKAYIDNIEYGVGLLRTEKFCELTITTSSLDPSSIISWEDHLLNYAARYNLISTYSDWILVEDRPSLFTKLRVFRLLSYVPADPQTMVHIYCRIFASTAARVTLESYVISEPSKHRREVLQRLFRR